MSHAQDYYENYGGESVADYVERHLRQSPTEAERIDRLVSLANADARNVLDVGAGHGLLLEALAARRGIRGIGIEITQAKVDYARSRGVNLQIGDASRLTFDDRSFDLLYCCEVLEHLPFGVFESACQELARVARNQIIISVPFDEMRHFVRCPYCGASVNPNYHFRSFDATSMAKLLPGWRLESSFGLGREPHGRLKHLLRPLFNRGWPSLLVCASCGWRPAQLLPESRPSALGLARRLAQAMPTPSRPLWRIGIFRHQG